MRNFIHKDYCKEGKGLLKLEEGYYCNRENAVTIRSSKAKRGYLLWRGVSKARKNWIWGRGMKEYLDWINRSEHILP